MIVVWRMSVVAPDCVAALEKEINGKQSGRLKTEVWHGISRCLTFIHMLALPAQLRKSFERSFREKNRSSTADPIT